ncbi:hypothetical protein LTR28_013549 [Elasticomyces elasticus]|nr:hypothetical protein LTR28_013549 [Elasticomyces elasticus]
MLLIDEATDVFPGDDIVPPLPRELLDIDMEAPFDMLADGLRMVLNDDEELIGIFVKLVTLASVELAVDADKQDETLDDAEDASMLDVLVARLVNDVITGGVDTTGGAPGGLVAATCGGPVLTPVPVTVPVMWLNIVQFVPI